jgi:hypothetical protein
MVITGAMAGNHRQQLSTGLTAPYLSALTFHQSAGAAALTSPG